MQHRAPHIPNRARLVTEHQRHRLDPAFPIRRIPWVHPDAPITKLHRHDVLELGVCLEGEGTFVVEDKELPYRAGSVVAVDASELHFSRSRPRTVSRWEYLFLDPQRLIPLAGPARAMSTSTTGLAGPGFANVIAPERAPGLAEVVRLLARELASRGRREAAVRGLAAAAMGMLHPLRIRGAAPHGVDNDGVDNDGVDNDGVDNDDEDDADVTALAPALARIRALANVSGTPRGTPLIDELAAACGLRLRTFTRRFERCLGDSPRRFLNRYRVAEACRLLQDPRARVVDVAFATGFESVSAFNRQFRALVGCTPRAWRRVRA